MDEDGRARGRDDSAEDSLDRVGGSKPVSYTHLDVYKRQHMNYI